jgi:tRNA (mo5U34)-methyltransferase
MPNFQPLLRWMQNQPDLKKWADQLPSQLQQGLSVERWGDLPDWQAVLDNLPAVSPSSVDFQTAVRIGEHDDLDDSTRESLRQNLMGLHPWRKGPWQLFGVDIDTEWRSDWKWDRLAPHLRDLTDQLVLDVGCGNGYHCMRMFGAGARRVIGIDPSAKFVYQFEVFKTYCPDLPVDILPLGIEHLPPRLHGFDTVLSMGVIYHRRDPLAHIQELMDCLKPGGQLVLETLVVEGETSLIPKERYAKMRNVWCVPSPSQVLEWMAELKLKNPRMVDLCSTTTEEQRKTEWMRFESLADFLHPDDPNLTVEGYPAPRRAIFLAET